MLLACFHTHFVHYGVCMCGGGCVSGVVYWMCHSVNVVNVSTVSTDTTQSDGREWRYTIYMLLNKYDNILWFFAIVVLHFYLNIVARIWHNQQQKDKIVFIHKIDWIFRSLARSLALLIVLCFAKTSGTRGIAFGRWLPHCWWCLHYIHL